MTRHEEVERAANELILRLKDAELDGDGSPECHRTWDSGWGVVEAIEALDAAIALSRRDDEKAVAVYCYVVESIESPGESSLFHHDKQAAIRQCERLNTGHAEPHYRVVPLYTRPDGHDAGAGKCGTCGSENRGPVLVHNDRKLAKGEPYFKPCPDPFHAATGEAKS